MEDQEYAALQDLGGRLDTLIDDAEELRSDLGEARISLSRLLRSGAGAGPPADDPGTDPPDAGERWEIKLGAKDIEIEADTLRHFDYLGTLFSLYVETVGGDATLWVCRTTRPGAKPLGDMELVVHGHGTPFDILEAPRFPGEIVLNAISFGGEVPAGRLDERIPLSARDKLGQAAASIHFAEVAGRALYWEPQMGDAGGGRGIAPFHWLFSCREGRAFARSKLLGVVQQWPIGFVDENGLPEYVDEPWWGGPDMGAQPGRWAWPATTEANAVRSQIRRFDRQHRWRGAQAIVIEAAHGNLMARWLLDLAANTVLMEEGIFRESKTTPQSTALLWSLEEKLQRLPRGVPHYTTGRGIAHAGFVLCAAARWGLGRLNRLRAKEGVELLLALLAHVADENGCTKAAPPWAQKVGFPPGSEWCWAREPALVIAFLDQACNALLGVPAFEEAADLRRRLATWLGPDPPKAALLGGRVANDGGLGLEKDTHYWYDLWTHRDLTKAPGGTAQGLWEDFQRPARTAEENMLLCCPEDLALPGRA